jgi:hypothetical protein
MAKRKEIEATGEDAAVAAKAAARAAAKAELLRHLTAVESPSISPAASEPVNADATANETADEMTNEPKSEPEAATAKSAKPTTSFALVPLAAPSAEHIVTPPDTPRFALKARHKHYARLAASVAIGAVIGVVIGTVATTEWSQQGAKTAAPVDVAALEENKAMQQSLTRLAKDVTVLKANLAAAKKQAQERTERMRQATADVTGSISAPQTVAAAASPPPVLSAAPATIEAAAPLPIPRPAQHLAAIESPPPAVRGQVLRDWSIHDARGGYVYVEGHGDIYQVVPGAPLPGLGPVQSIRRVEGRWVVTTPKGIIVSNFERRFFE